MKLRYFFIFFAILFFINFISSADFFSDTKIINNLNENKAWFSTERYMPPSNVSLFPVEDSGVNLFWNYSIDGIIETSSVVSSVSVNGTSYVHSCFGSNNGYFYCLDALNGSLKWKYKTNDSVRSSPLYSYLYQGSSYIPNVYFGNDAGYFYCLDFRDGSLNWKFETNGSIRGSSAYYNNKIYFGSSDSYLYAVNFSDGVLSWKYKAEDSIESSVGVSNSVYFGDEAGYFYCLDYLNGNLKWKFKTNGSIKGSFAYYGYDVFFGSSDGYLYAVNSSNGILNWKYKTNGSILGSPLYSDSKIYFGSSDGYLYSLYLNGGLNWKYYSGNEIKTTPLIVQGNVIFANSEGLHFVDIERGGKRADFLSSSIEKSPKTFYYNYDNYLYFGRMNEFNALKIDKAMEFSDSEYGFIEFADENYVIYSDANYESNYFKFNISEDVNQIIGLYFYYKGYSDISVTNFYIYDFKRNSWDLLGDIESNGMELKKVLKKGNINDSIFKDYVNDSEIRLVVQAYAYGGGSCPFVYSYDGKKYWFDHEGFAFATMNVLEDTSYGNLENLKEVDGKYLLKIKEELDETSYINNFKLKAIDFKGEGRIVPDLNGNFYVVREYRNPLSCHSSENENCLKEISVKDNEFWKSSKREKDWIELEFDSVSDSGKLVIEFQSAKILKKMWKYYIDLIGKNNWNLFESLSEINFVRKMLLEQKDRISLEVQVLKNGEWVSKEYLKSGRERLSESLIYLEDLEKEKVKIRIRNTQFYEIDRVYIDFSEEGEIQINELELFSILKSGVDVSEKISEKDKNYIAMEKRDVVDLVYDAPELREGFERDFIVEIGGYYNYQEFEERSFKEMIEGFGEWFRTYFDKDYVIESMKKYEEVHDSLYSDFVSVNVSYLSGDSGIAEVIFENSNNSYAREEFVKLSCRSLTVGGASIGLKYQFKNGSQWYDIPIRDDEISELDEKKIDEDIEKLQELIYSVERISEKELKENKNPKLEKKWVRIYPDSERELRYLISLSLDVLKYNKKYVEAVVTSKEIEKLNFNGLDIEELKINSGDVFSDEGFRDYHSYSESVSFMNDIENSYPEISKVYEIGKSIENRSIFSLKISDNVEIDENESEILIVGNHHAREIMTVEIPLYEIKYLVENYESDYRVRKLVDEREIWFVPVMNPDGLVYVENNDTMWRKNRRDNGDGYFGVDLNRNYGYKWGYDNVGSSPTTSSDTYRGASAFSEPETRAVRDFVLSHNISYGLSYHSYGEYLLYPWGYVNKHTSDSERFLELTQGMLKDLDYQHGTPGELLYVTNGDFNDWVYGDNSKNKIFGMTFEVNSNSQGGFRPDASLIIPTCEEHLEPFLYFVESAGEKINIPLEISDNNFIDIINNKTYSEGVIFHENREYDLRCVVYNLSDDIFSDLINFDIQTPEVSIDILNPFNEDDVEKEEVFDFKVNVSCSEFNCGNLSVFLDPKSNVIKKKYKFEKPNIDRYEKYDVVRMNELNHYGEPGYPILPFKTVRFLIPENTEVESVEVIGNKRNYLGEEFYLRAGDSYVPLCDCEGDFEEKEPVKEIYESSKVYPEKLYANYKVESFRGYKIFLMNIYPVQYIGKTGELYYFEDIEVNVNLKGGKRVLESAGNYRGNKKDRDSVLEIIDNKEEIIDYSVESRIFSNSFDSEYYDYVIITKEDYRDEFQVLRDDKNSRGVDTKIVSVEWIESNFSGLDRQEKVRNFIKQAYADWGIDYVLLGGDRNVIPARKFYANADGTVDNIPADLYYACLDGNWDDDGDGVYGEVGEEDWFAEVYVGRVAVRNEQDVINFVNKVISYQRTYSVDDKDILLVGEGLWSDNCYHIAEPGDPPAPQGNWGGYYMNELVGYRTINNISSQGYQSDYYNITRLYDGYRERDGESPWTTEELMQEINNGVNMLNHLGHGAPSSAMKMSFSNIDALENTNYLNIFSQSCSSGRFDDQECMAQRFTIAEKGAVSYIGNSRYGWGIRGVNDGGTCETNGPDQRQHRFYVNALAGENILNIGKAYQKSKHDDIDYILDGPECGTGAWPCRGVQRWVSFSHNLFGDPELKLHLRGISINSLRIEPEPIGLNERGKCIAEINEYNPEANISLVVFRVYFNDSLEIEFNGSQMNNSFWESGEFVADKEGIWYCEVYVEDNLGAKNERREYFIPGEEKGLVSTEVGAKPFYTLDVNPQFCNLNEDESCVVNWKVVPTGAVNSSWKFFAYVNSERLMYLGDVSEKIDLNIVESLGIPEDINGDGEVDIQDLVRVALRIGESCSGSSWCDGCDLNQDGVVDIQDLVRVALKI